MSELRERERCATCGAFLTPVPDIIPEDKEKGYPAVPFWRFACTNPRHKRVQTSNKTGEENE